MTESTTAATTAPTVLGLCLAGPTACGKSGVAMALAQQLPLEIISVDSAQVYRGMDIGTAKPDAAERAAVPHHLIDICEPDEPYSAARFASQAQQLAEQIRSRGKLPLLVGGTMLYFKALRDGFNALPGADAATRAQIDHEAGQRGWPALHAELALVDPETAARLAPADAQRIQRALEVWRLSGRAISVWHQNEPQDAPAVGAWPMLSLEPASRAWLHGRIAQRWQQMISQGFIEEILRLHQRPGLHASLPALRSVGYRQAWQALEEALKQGKSGTTLGAERAWQEAAIAATRQLAKRQLTWLRSTPDRQILHGDQAGLHETCLRWVKQHWQGPASLGPAPQTPD